MQEFDMVDGMDEDMMGIEKMIALRIYGYNQNRTARGRVGL
jgi:hypothetical protein